MFAGVSPPASWRLSGEAGGWKGTHDEPQLSPTVPQSPVGLELHPINLSAIDGRSCPGIPDAQSVRDSLFQTVSAQLYNLNKYFRFQLFPE